ncbi:hypothetical protein RHMOL_Rhmol01G0129400 [Rhododendron molle]|uniref:Uncharacterized protein n=2 Tax=Rhododendron molle TaxID=49168 RepID=A0ACC0NXG9_RHOML|nr:hypothetical protein RHMOL_Rhmol04G0021600 [Rhododendron molle]KAI8571559.1 hypothetical protein RHMOL_Rhmol01G0129400 [Rhododendron molle]
MGTAAHGTALMHGHPDTRDVRFHEFKEHFYLLSEIEVFRLKRKFHALDMSSPLLTGHQYRFRALTDTNCYLHDRNVAMMTSRKDTRYAINLVVTHGGTKFPCWALHNLMSFKQNLELIQGISKLNTLICVFVLQPRLSCSCRAMAR